MPVEFSVSALVDKVFQLKLYVLMDGRSEEINLTGLDKKTLDKKAPKGSKPECPYHMVNLFMQGCPQDQAEVYYGLICMANDAMRNEQNTQRQLNKYRMINNKIMAIPYIKEQAMVWCENNIPIPKGILDSYDSGVLDGWFKRDSTYIKADYIALFSMSLQLKLCVPIMMSLVTLGPEVGDLYKESAAIKYVPGAIKKLNAYERLRKYVRAQGLTEPTMFTVIYQNVSSVDFEEWIFDMMITRRLMSSVMKHHIPSWSYMQIHYRAKPNSPKTMLTPKIISDGTDDEKSTSVLEMVRNRRSFSIAQQVYMAHTLSREYLVRHFCDVVDEKEFMNLSSYVRDIEYHPPRELVYIATWLLGHKISKAAMQYAPHNRIRNLLVMAALFMKAHGVPYLTLLLLSSARIENGKYVSSGTVNSSTTKSYVKHITPMMTSIQPKFRKDLKEVIDTTVRNLVSIDLTLTYIPPDIDKELVKSVSIDNSLTIVSDLGEILTSAIKKEYLKEEK